MIILLLVEFILILSLLIWIGKKYLNKFYYIVTIIVLTIAGVVLFLICNYLLLVVAMIFDM